MWALKSKNWYKSYICLLVKVHHDGFSENEYEISSCDEEEATKFIRKSGTENIIKHFGLEKEYKIVKIK